MSGADIVDSMPAVQAAAAAAVSTAQADPDPMAGATAAASVKFWLLAGGKGVATEIALPAECNGELDEKQPLHLLAWYIQANMAELLPIAIKSWHSVRPAILAAVTGGAANDAAGGEPPSEVVGGKGFKLLGPDARSL